nr:MAG TPA: hypothetical protein [Caudoviricetes sp.]
MLQLRCLLTQQTKLKLRKKQTSVFQKWSSV